MTIDLKTVKHISKLSRISIEEEKAKRLTNDLNSIFKFIEKLNELDTSKTEPLTSVAETTLKLRKDIIESKNIREDILKSIIDTIPNKRLGESDEIAEMVQYLISEKASYINGSTISINGGLWMD